MDSLPNITTPAEKYRNQHLEDVPFDELAMKIFYLNLVITADILIK